MPDAPPTAPWNFDELPPGMGDEGSSQAVAATQALPASSTPPAPTPTKFDPSAINALYQNGRISYPQYQQMGGSLPPNANPPVAPALQQQAAQAPAAQIKPIASITAPPTPGQQASAVGGTNDPRDQALASMLSPRNVGGAVRPLGMSRADKAYAQGLNAAADDLNDSYRQAIAQNQDAVSAFKDNSSALADDSRIGALSYQQCRLPKPLTLPYLRLSVDSLAGLHPGSVGRPSP